MAGMGPALQALAILFALALTPGNCNQLGNASLPEVDAQNIPPFLSNWGEVCVESPEVHIDDEHRTGCAKGLQCFHGMCGTNASHPWAEEDDEDAATELDRSFSSLRNWMSSLSDSEYITRLTIPGTHDTMTAEPATEGYNNHCKATPCCMCQTQKLKHQLEAGIRMIDLRLRCYYDEFWLYHGSISLGCTLKKALTIIKHFLNKNPKETVVVSYQKERDPYGCSKSFKSLLKGEVEKYMPANRRWNGNVRKHIRLRSVRGKVIFMDARKSGRIPATAWLPYYSSWVVDNKWDDMTNIDVVQSYLYLKDFEIQPSYYKRLKGNVDNAIGFWKAAGGKYRTKTGFITWTSANDCGPRWGSFLMPPLVPTPYRKGFIFVQYLCGF